MEESNEPKPRRHWFSFSLRTLFVILTALCIWMGYQLNWIREREHALENGSNNWRVQGFLGNAKAPRLLWLLGGRGYAKVCIWDASPQLMQKFQDLFPEAVIERIKSPPQFSEMPGKVPDKPSKAAEEVQEYKQQKKRDRIFNREL